MPPLLLLLLLLRLLLPPVLLGPLLLATLLLLTLLLAPLLLLPLLPASGMAMQATGSTLVCKAAHKTASAHRPDQ